MNNVINQDEDVSPLFDIVVAYDIDTGGIGRAGSLPWHIPADLQRFRRLTTNTRDPEMKNVVIMGRKTHESLPTSTLKNRINIVLSHTPCRSVPEEANVSCAAPMYCMSLDAALMLAGHLQKHDAAENIFVIGGQEVYKEAMLSRGLRCIYATAVQPALSMDCHYDAFFPKDALTSMSLLGMSDWHHNEDGLLYKYMTYENIAN